MFLLSSLEHIGEMSVHKILMAIIRRFLTFGALKILCQTLERIPPTYLRQELRLKLHVYLFVYFRSFPTTFYRKNSAGFELRSSEQNVSSLTTKPPPPSPRPTCLADKCFLLLFETGTQYLPSWYRYSVTRLGDLLDFGQLFKAFSNNYFAQISHILRHFL